MAFSSSYTPIQNAERRLLFCARCSVRQMSRQSSTPPSRPTSKRQSSSRMRHGRTSKSLT
jgi:hypothetical protein